MHGAGISVAGLYGLQAAGGGCASGGGPCAGNLSFGVVAPRPLPGRGPKSLAVPHCGE
ncbi:hypothetical protein SDC9_134385 [bioreactor metagenome]|uniref:Uncharacterized protein n=1 Tax=bioreactor metagenome TaxID=1076179 RepID=A0A645DDG7_9ZZZZ